MSLWDYASPFLGPIGSIAGGFLDYRGQNSANRANRDIASSTNASNLAIAKSQMDFQERMSSSSWQRGVKDMEAAGINPLLAVSQGGASSPAGAAVGATTGAPIQNVFGGAGKASATAIQAMRTHLELEQLREQNRKIVSDRDLNNVLKIKALADSRLSENNAKVAAANARNAGLATPGLREEAKIDDTRFGKALRYLGRLNPFGHSASAVMKAIK